MARAAFHHPGAQAARVDQRFDRAERLRGDDEQRALGIQLRQQAREFRAVDVRQKVHVGAVLMAVGQCIDDQFRAKPRAADADMNDGGDGLAGEAAPLTAAHLAREFLHARERALNLRPHAFRLRLGGRAQGRVQYRTLFGRVQLVVDEQRGASFRQTGIDGELFERREHCGVEALLAQVQQQGTGAKRQRVEARGSRAQFRQFERQQFPCEPRQRVPRGQGSRVDAGRCCRAHCRAPCAGPGAVW